MPAFAALSETVRWQLVAWIRSRGGARLRVRATDGGAGYAWDLPPGFPQPKVPADNPMTAAKVALGRHLFYDTRLSADGTFSCGTCHVQRIAFTDGKSRAVGHSGQIAPARRDVAGQRRLRPGADLGESDRRAARSAGAGADARHRSRGAGLGGTEREMLARLAAEPRYPAMFGDAFPGEPAPITVANVTRAIAAFERTLLWDVRRTDLTGPVPIRG